MNEAKQIPFIVHRDGEIDTELSVLPLTGIGAAAERLRTSITNLTGSVALQARMVTFDAMHGTDYRRIRNNLVAQKRRADFELSIGLVAIGRD